MADPAREYLVKLIPTQQQPTHLSITKTVTDPSDLLTSVNSTLKPGHYNIYEDLRGATSIRPDNPAHPG